MTLLPTNPSGDPAAGPGPGAGESARSRRCAPPPPSGWYIALKFWGDGTQFNGPGNLAFDSAGPRLGEHQCHLVEQPAGRMPGRRRSSCSIRTRRGSRSTRYDGRRPERLGIRHRARPAGAASGSTNFGFTSSLMPDRSCRPSNSVSAVRPDGHAALGRRGLPRRAAQLAAGREVGRRTATSGSRTAATTTLVVVPPAAIPAGSGSSARASTERLRRRAEHRRRHLRHVERQRPRSTRFDQDGTPLPGSPFGDATTLGKPARHRRATASATPGSPTRASSTSRAVPASPSSFRTPTPSRRARWSWWGRDGVVTRFEGPA